MTTCALRSVNDVPAIFERVCGRDFRTSVLAGAQGSQDLRNVPFPRGGDVDEVEIVAGDESFEVVFAVCVNGRCLLTSLLDELGRTLALLFDDIANSIDDHLIDSEKLSEHLGATQTHGDDSETHDVVRFEADPDHRSLLPPTRLHWFL